MGDPIRARLDTAIRAEYPYDELETLADALRAVLDLCDRAASFNPYADQGRKPMVDVPDIRRAIADALGLHGGEVVPDA